MDLNFDVLDILTKCLQMKLEFETTTEYFQEVPDGVMDFRFLANGKKDNSQFETYTQVFDNKQGFLSNLSVLDLIFNEGKFALDYLKTQKLLF